ncbi:TRAP transporter substrate-binding protein [Pelagibius marinus]|uniref:TRAP transporter substrate-binding protein n=1 Tax=Pelagibius marinus TaxID=2762760 RepID=UPI001872F9CF|nr:TRAP transporter substrate-binding protein [Pelagibius marinus]
MKRIAFGAMAAAVTLAANGVHAQEVTLRYSEWLPPTYFMNERGLYPYFEEIERVTEGRVVVEKSAAPLGPPPRNYQLALDGIADITWGLHGYTPGTFPLSEMVELPFHSTDAEKNSVAYWRVFKEFLEPAGMHPGVHTLTVHTQPPGQLFNRVRPIGAPGDFQGLKIRSTNSGVANAIARLGATPVGIPVTEMREALEKGIVDGVSLTDEALFNFHIQEFVSYEMAVPGGLYNASMFLVVNEAKWNQISPEDREAIMSISGETLARKLGRVWQDEQDAAVQKARDAGIDISVPEGELLDYLHEQLDSLETELVEKVDAKGVDGAAVLKAYRDLSGSDG